MGSSGQAAPRVLRPANIYPKSRVGIIFTVELFFFVESHSYVIGFCSLLNYYLCTCSAGGSGPSRTESLILPGPSPLPPFLQNFRPRPPEKRGRSTRRCNPYERKSANYGLDLYLSALSIIGNTAQQ